MQWSFNGQHPSFPPIINLQQKKKTSLGNICWGCWHLWYSPKNLPNQEVSSHIPWKAHSFGSNINVSPKWHYPKGVIQVHHLFRWRVLFSGNWSYYLRMCFWGNLGLPSLQMVHIVFGALLKLFPIRCS